MAVVPCPPSLVDFSEHHGLYIVVIFFNSMTCLARYAKLLIKIKNPWKLCQSTPLLTDRCMEAACMWQSFRSCSVSFQWVENVGL